MKKTLVIAVVLLLGLGIAFVVTRQFTRGHQKAPALQGLWEGALEVQGVRLRLVLKVDPSPDGGYRATMDSVDQGAKDIPVSLVTLSNRTVRVELTPLNAAYQAELDSRATEMSGQWRQGGLSNPLMFRRTTNPSAVAVPLPPDSYAFSSASELQGLWNGTLDVRGAKLRLALKIAKAADGSHLATLDSIDQGARDIPATSVKFKDSDVELEWSALGALFHGSLEGGKLAGFWLQGPGEFPLEFERTNRVAVAATPIPGGR